MERPAFKKLTKQILNDEIFQLVCWRIDRISRSLCNFVNFYEILKKHKVTLTSIRDNVDFNTPVGEFILNSLANFAQLERSMIRDRIKTGISVSKKQHPEKFRGGKKGRIIKITPVHRKKIPELKASGMNVTNIMMLTRLSRPSVYKVLKDNAEVSGMTELSVKNT